jgi:hypothetical protein
MHRDPGRIKEANGPSQVDHDNPVSNLFRNYCYLLEYLLDLLISGNYIIHWTNSEKTSATSPLLPAEDLLVNMHFHHNTRILLSSLISSDNIVAIYRPKVKISILKLRDFLITSLAANPYEARNKHLLLGSVPSTSGRENPVCPAKADKSGPAGHLNPYGLGQSGTNRSSQAQPAAPAEESQTNGMSGRSKIMGVSFWK